MWDRAKGHGEKNIKNNAVLFKIGFKWLGHFNSGKACSLKYDYWNFRIKFENKMRENWKRCSWWTVSLISMSSKWKSGAKCLDI